MAENEYVPYSEKAERGVIGAALQAYDQVIPVAMAKYFITDESFYDAATRLAWSAMVELMKRGRPIDILTVTNALEEMGKLDQIGGCITLNRFVDDTPSVANFESYCDIVRQKALLRSFIALGREQIMQAQSANGDTDEIVCGAPEKFLALVQVADNERSNADIMAERLRAWKDASEKKLPAIGLQTPWKKLTYLLCGLETGVTVVAGRPSAGKTTFEDQLCIYQAMQGNAVYRVTLDSTRQELLERAICRGAELSLPKMKFGFGTRKQHANAEEYSKTLANLPIYIDDRTRDIADICAKARAMKAKKNIKMVTVDYIQLVRARDMGRSEWDAVTRVTYVSGMLKDLAFRLQIPVLVLCQLSRSVEKEGREPQLSDLRDSGAIEQDASKVIFLYIDGDKRKEMEERNQEATKHKRPVIVNLMKHKNGETGFLPFWLYPPYFRFAQAETSAEGMFLDDKLPLTQYEDQREMEQVPEYMPRDEELG